MPRFPKSTAARALALSVALALPIGLAVATERAGEGARPDPQAPGLPAIGTVLGTDAGSVSRALTASGLSVHEVERERGRIEAEVRSGGREWYVIVDPRTGAVAEVRRDD